MHTLQEVSTVLGINYMTLVRYARTGRIKAVKIGRVWRVSDEELTRIQNEGIK